jgi:peptidoglycan hydrolase-like protein with peptidoglycan-binding domain
MVLANGDNGDNLKDLQQALNKLGSLLLVDGDFGGSSEAAVLDARDMLGLPVQPDVDDALTTELAALPELSALTAPGRCDRRNHQRLGHRASKWPREPERLSAACSKF